MTLRRILISAVAPHLLSIGQKRPPDFVIGEGTPYLARWWLIPKNPWFNIYLHHFLRSDDDRALHDHPWWNVSVVLKGLYTEHTIEAGGVHRRALRLVGDVVFRRARQAHRIELTAGHCWSLFVTGPKVREWGFHCVQGWRHWTDFCAVTPDGQNAGGVGKGCE